jgi:prepilin signal peptidase PulO-like enzyme (type II secretory pathway)
MIATVAAAVFFGCVGVIALYGSRALCAGIPAADDGPPAGRPPYAVLVIACALLGGVLVIARATPLELGIAAIVVFALVACWCSDALCGLVPDVFTLAPLAALLLFAAAQRDWGIVISALVVFLPFAAAAFYSRGYGMGWGDAKLVAISGAVLGAPLALMALAAACAAAVVIHQIVSARRGTPIAFAPYIAAATGIALPLGLAH